MRSVNSLSVAAISAFLLCGCERWALDQQMKELCKTDGGIRVYEKVTLPASEFSNIGQPFARYERAAKSRADLLGPDYRYVEERKLIVGPHANAQKGEGQLTRWYHAIYRRADGRLLGESVRYNRSGGDGITLGFQPSGKNCPPLMNGLAQTVFTKED